VPEILVVGLRRPAASRAGQFEDGGPRRFGSPGAGAGAGSVRCRYAVTTAKTVFDCLFEVTGIRIRE
jgi:hypothetical protein